MSILNKTMAYVAPGKDWAFSSITKPAEFQRELEAMNPDLWLGAVPKPRWRVLSQVELGRLHDGGCAQVFDDVPPEELW